MNFKLSPAILVLTIASMGIAGCTDQEAEENKRKAQLYDSQIEKQGKLEKCFQYSRDVMLEAMRLTEKEHPECYKKNIAQNVASQCNEMEMRIMQNEKDDEDRCMKLYK